MKGNVSSAYLAKCRAVKPSPEDLKRYGVTLDTKTAATKPDVILTKKEKRRLRRLRRLQKAAATT